MRSKQPPPIDVSDRKTRACKGDGALAGLRHCAQEKGTGVRFGTRIATVAG